MTLQERWATAMRWMVLANEPRLTPAGKARRRLAAEGALEGYFKHAEMLVRATPQIGV